MVDTLARAMDLMENNKTEEALELAERLREKSTDEELYFIGEFYWYWGFYGQAKEVFKDLVAIFPDENELKVMLADIYIELDDDQEAIQLLDEIPSEDSFYLQALVQLADLYQSEGLLEVAEQKLLEAQKIAPEEPIITFALAEFFFSIGDFKRAIIYYDKLYPDQNMLADVNIISRLAESYSAIGEYEKALEFYQKEEQSHPDDLFKYGLTATYAKRPEIAISSFEKLLEIDDNYHSAYYELAKVYADEEMIKESLETAEKGITKDEFNKELYYLAGTAAKKLKDSDLSEKYLQEAISLDPDFKKAVIALNSIFEEEERFSDSIELFEAIKSQDIFDPHYEWMLAAAYYAEEEYEKAWQAYEQAYEHLSDDPGLLKEYGYFLAEEGKRDKAVELLKSYLKERPEDDEVIAFVERMTVDLDPFE